MSKVLAVFYMNNVHLAALSLSNIFCPTENLLLMKSSFAITASVFALGQSLCAAQLGIVQPQFSDAGGDSLQIDPSTIKGLEGGNFNGKPEENAKEFEELWSNTGFTSLSQLVNTMFPSCDFDVGKTPRTNVTGVTEITLTGINIPGPMSFELNGVQIFHTNNALKDYPLPKTSYTIQVDFSSCQGNCTITFDFLILTGIPSTSLYSTFQCKEGGGDIYLFTH
ncbi:hypothetical protein PsorP6_014140 [Peronosclerospora sorghi]|uniref:Uncharacterized protein n=1 Tax=Peronosclerospora sorghi TaxID=230839 RepID=A0ACC0VI47_9STRA|nr:hypothetical protein PsorP6_014140 [Peronosclerospora sorghi]